MNDISLVFALIALLALNYSQAYPSGAPEEACEAVEPSHEDYKPKTSQSPFSLSTDKITYAPGDMVTIKIEGSGGSKFKGFLIVAKASTTSSDFLGKFNSGTQNKKLQCPNGVSKIKSSL